MSWVHQFSMSQPTDIEWLYIILTTQKWYRPYAIDIITQITKCETDGGRKFAAILCGKNGRSLRSLSTVKYFASSLLTSAGNDLHPECIMSQQDLTLTEANKLTCTPCWHCELAKCFAVLKRHIPWSSLPLKWQCSIRISIHCPFHIWDMVTWGIA